MCFELIIAARSNLTTSVWEDGKVSRSWEAQNDAREVASAAWLEGDPGQVYNTA